MKETRRDTLKILGAISTTCAFPFSANELYGQHVHSGPASAALAPAGPYKPAFFGPAEWDRLGKLADLIIPPTDTPGAVAAGVPQYIDQVLTNNSEHRGLMRSGLGWIEDRVRELHSESFVKLTEEQQIGILQPLSDQADRHPQPSAEDPPARFFRALKNLTADGYYTSRAGLVQELGYQGNSVLSQFPGCTTKI